MLIHLLPQPWKIRLSQQLQKRARSLLTLFLSSSSHPLRPSLRAPQPRCEGWITQAYIRLTDYVWQDNACQDCTAPIRYWTNPC